MQSVGEGHNAGSEKHACMNTYSGTDFTPDETFSLQGSDITHEKTPQSFNRQSIFGRVTRLREFDYS